MKLFIRNFTFVLFLLLVDTGLSSCGSAGSVDEDVGTVVTRPTIPVSGLFPDFDASITETTLGGESETESLSADSFLTALDSNLNIFNVWNEVIINGSFFDIRNQREALESFGELSSEALQSAGIDELDEAPQTVDLEEEADLVDTTTLWSLEMVEASEDDDFIRFYFSNQETSLLQATYLVKTDDDGVPVKGLFAYVNPDKLSEEATDGYRLLILAYDFEGTNNRLVIHSEVYSDVTGRYHAQTILEECFDSSTECTGGFFQVTEEAPSRELDDISFIFTWDEADSGVCLVETDYSSGALEVVETYSFTGPEGPEADQSNVALGTCTATDAIFTDSVITEGHLIERYEDTTPVGGNAEDYYIDGSSKEGWNTLTPSLIDSLLDASYGGW